MKNKKIEVGSFSDTALSIVPELSAFLTPEIITSPQAVAVAVSTAILSKKLSQWYQEFTNWREKNKDKINLQNEDLQQSFGELLNFINKENPDRERLIAAKAMFFAMNTISESEANKILLYELFHIGLRISSSELSVLKECWNSFKSEKMLSSNPPEWVIQIADRIGHHMSALVEKDEKSLVEFNLITKRRFDDGSGGVIPAKGRLTDLGIVFCEYLNNYQEENEKTR